MSLGSTCEYIIDTNLVVDYALRTRFTHGRDVIAASAKYLEYLSKGHSVCILNVIKYEFLAKLLDKLAEAVIPLSQLRSAYGDPEEFMNKWVDSLLNGAFGYANIDWDDVEDSTNIMAQVRSKGVRHMLGRDIIYLVAASRRGAVFVTKDENLKVGLQRLGQAVLSDPRISIYQFMDVKLYLCDYDVDINLGNKDIRGRFVLVAQSPNVCGAPPT